MNAGMQITQATRRLSPCGLRCAACGIFLLLSATLHADTLVLKNGQEVVGKIVSPPGGCDLCDHQGRMASR